MKYQSCEEILLVLAAICLAISSIRNRSNSDLSRWRHCLKIFVCHCRGWELLSLKGNSKICCHRSSPDQVSSPKAIPSIFIPQCVKLFLFMLVRLVFRSVTLVVSADQSLVLSRTLLTWIRGTLHPRAWLERTCSFQRILFVVLIIFSA